MATGMCVVVWEHTTDRGDWAAYDAVVSNFIEDNSSLNFIKLGNVDQSLASVAINIGKMVQVNQFGIERPIRREFYDGNSAVARGAVWQWKQDAWFSYPTDVANVLEAAYNRNILSRVDLDAPPVNEPYVVDLAQMVQINKTSGFARPVQRLVTNVRYRTVATNPYQTMTNSSGATQLPWSQYSGGYFPFGTLGSGATGGFASAPQPQPVTKAAFVFGPPSSAPSAATLSQSSQPAYFFGGGNASAMNPPFVPGPASSVMQAARTKNPKRVRALRRNLTSGVSSTVPVSSPPLVIPSSSNWSYDVNGQQQSGTMQGLTSNAFSSWRSPPNQSGSSGISNDMQLGQNPPLASSSIYNGAGPNSGGSTVSIFKKIPGVSALMSGFSSMVINSFRYVATGGSSSQSANPGVSTPSTTSMANKSGARSLSHTYVNTKRLKVSGNQLTSFQQDDLSHIQKLTASDVLSRYIKKVPKPPAHEDCCICCDSLREASGYGQGNSYAVVQLAKCSHMFHMDCLTAMYDSSSKNGSVQCPNCKTIYGVKNGNCPNGTMEYRVIEEELPGNRGCSTIEIKYNINGGMQSEGHPHPRHPYKVRGFPRFGYLPNNQDGQKALSLLEIAWKRRLTFTVGTSVTTGEPDVVVWNEIHHKTEKTNASGHGYPDPKYLSNVFAELAAQGVTDDDE